MQLGLAGLLGRGRTIRNATQAVWSGNWGVPAHPRKTCKHVQACIPMRLEQSSKPVGLEYLICLGGKG
eukprot:1138987-Pelagomonas_calceolata.AAC.15